MAKYCGKNFLLQVEDTPASGTFTSVATIRDVSLSISNEQVDTTDKTIAPARELKNCGINSMSISGAGIFSDDAPLAIIQARSHDGALYNYRLISDRGDQYQGAFQTATFDRTGAFNNSEEFSISLESSGVIVFTPTP